MRPVIFDCDGVLVDSEAIGVEIELACLAELGLRYERHDYIARFLGGSGQVFYAGLDADHQRVLGAALPADFGARLKARWEAEFARLTAIAGVHAIVEGIPIKAVASGSSITALDKKLRHVGLFELLAPHIYSSELVERGKPSPDIFLYAAERLRVPARTCIVVEDSANGVRAACAAGMIVVGFTGGGHCPPAHGDTLRAAGAVIVVETMPHLMLALEAYQETFA